MDHNSDRCWKAAELLGALNDVEAQKAPECMFVRGDRDLLQSAPRVSIVGARKASVDGRKRAAKLARMLVAEGGVVVSGLAKGIDHAAHTAAIGAGGRTIAVIGTPLDRCYPAEHRQLQETIATEHLLVSQFPAGTTTRPHHFPMRNRTMALISHATVIVEAGETSGSLSQGWEALRLGRPLFLAAWLLSAGLEWPSKLMDHGASVLSDETFDELLAATPTGSDLDLAEL